MVPQSDERLSRALRFTPLVFVGHVLEEIPGFVPWFDGTWRGASPRTASGP